MTPCFNIRAPPITTGMHRDSRASKNIFGVLHNSSRWIFLVKDFFEFHSLPTDTISELTFVIFVWIFSEHINHIRKIAGVDHIGLGGDFNGITRWVFFYNKYFQLGLLPVTH